MQKSLRLGIDLWYPSYILNQIKVENVNRMLDQVERETAFVKLGWVIKDTMSRRQVQNTGDKSLFLYQYRKYPKRFKS